MPDYVVDTNVLLVASAQHPYSPFGGSDLEEPLREDVFNWLSSHCADATGRMVWDRDFRVYEEYRKKLTDQDFGLLVVHEKMVTSRQVDIAYDSDGHAVVPPSFNAFDRSDRKFLAVLLQDGNGSRLANATDTDWLTIEQQLKDSGISCDHLIESWLRAKHAEKEARK